MTRKTISSLTRAVAAAALSLALLPATAQAQEPYIGELQSFGFNFCPRGWAAANGQILPINQNQTLYSLLGTIYGGDGRTTFALPDLRGRAALNQGQAPGLQSYRIGEKGGAESVTLTQPELPAHSHPAKATSADAGLATAADALYGTAQPANSNTSVFGSGPADVQLAARSTTNAGGSQSHENRMPFIATNWCIALQGIYPSRS